MSGKLNLDVSIPVMELKIVLVLKEGKGVGFEFCGTIKDDLESFLGGDGVKPLQDLLFSIRDNVQSHLLTQGALVTEL